MARVLKASEGIRWPAHLERCRTADWLEPGEDGADVLARFHCWFRWIGYRQQYLLDLGATADDAQFDSVGAFPA